MRNGIICLQVCQKKGGHLISVFIALQTHVLKSLFLSCKMFDPGTRPHRASIPYSISNNARFRQSVYVKFNHTRKASIISNVLRWIGRLTNTLLVLSQQKGNKTVLLHDQKRRTDHMEPFLSCIERWMGGGGGGGYSRILYRGTSKEPL